MTIAAVLLGATHAVGIDTDAEAVRCSEENAKRNGVEERVKFRVGEARGIGDRYPLVVSNIDSDVLIRCAPAVARCVDGGGRLAVTGIWRTRADDVSAAYKTAGLDAARRTTEGDWVLLEFDKPDL
ncbi:MAG: 50S ribosomal protein L11 methyltransferase [Deltaproteobacteria bacterium]|nr:50S ribosomal protein L11 methyltransferase [Deltaproteobacteria bacterium]